MSFKNTIIPDSISSSLLQITSESTSKRDRALDAAKGLLILTVVYAHCFTEGVLHDYFFSFHMPAFFLISGITAAISRESEKDFGKTLLKMIRTIGLPYFFFELLGVLQELIRNGFEQSWKGFLFNALTLRCNNIVDWFLGTLLLAKLLSLALRKPLNRLLKRKAADMIYLTIALSAMATAILVSKTSPFAVIVLRRVLIAHGFLALGSVLEPLLRRKATLIGLAALAAAFGLSLLNTEFADINELHLGIPVVFLGASLLGSYGILQAGKLACVSPLCWLGRNSLIIMGTHIPILLLIRYVANNTAPTIWQRVIDLVLILVLEIPIIWFIRRFAPFLVGQNRRLSHGSKT